MNGFEKEFKLSNSFPSFKLEKSQKEKLLSEIQKNDLQISRKTIWSKKIKEIFALAATLLLSFGILAGILSYETAAFNQDKKILTDVSISMEKARIVLIKNWVDKSGIDSIDEANDLLEKYYTAEALEDMKASVERLYNKELMSIEDYDKNIIGTPAQLAMGNIHQGENIKIVKISREKVKVSWLDKKFNKKITVICILKEKSWRIEEIIL